MVFMGKQAFVSLLLLTHSVVGFSGPNAYSSNGSVNRRDVIRSTFVAVVGIKGRSAKAAYVDPKVDMPKVTKRVYLDVQLPEETDPNRVIIGLFGDAMPRTAENFAKLCEGKEGLSYAGTTFYRVLSDMSVQGGAVGDDSATGKTGLSSFEGGEKFEPDNFNIKHSREGLVSMVRAAGGGADSRFFINTSEDGGWADDRYAAFGIVEDGMDFVHRMEKIKVKQPQNSPKEPVRIVASGVLSS